MNRERSCATCRHRRRILGVDFCWYNAYETVVVDDITGISRKRWAPTPSCRTARTNLERSAGAYCGPGATNWEPKPTWGDLFRMTFGWIPKLFKHLTREEV